MTVQQSILLAVGASMMFCGAGLMTYGAVRRRPRNARADDPQSTKEEVILAIANLSRRFGEFFGPELAIKAGGVIFFAGLVMSAGAFLVPGPPG